MYSIFASFSEHSQQSSIPNNFVTLFDGEERSFARRNVGSIVLQSYSSRVMQYLPLNVNERIVDALVVRFNNLQVGRTYLKTKPSASPSPEMSYSFVPPGAAAVHRSLLARRLCPGRKQARNARTLKGTPYVNSCLRPVQDAVTDTARLAPAEPGVYIFRDGPPPGSKVLYVGKALSLYARLRSYIGIKRACKERGSSTYRAFDPGAATVKMPRIASMVAEARYVVYLW